MSDPRVCVYSSGDFKRILDNHEMRLLDSVFRLRPAEFGFRGPRLPPQPPATNLIAFPPHVYTRNGEVLRTKTHYLPQAAAEGYEALRGAMADELGRTLLLDSGYRSDYYQAAVFLSVLQTNSFDLRTTAQRVAIPGYSEHGSVVSTALDVMTVDGVPDDLNPWQFEETPEFVWLQTNARQFGFTMSYPRHNNLGVTYEPYHWRYIESLDMPVRHQ